jgi:hypothetical protein
MSTEELISSFYCMIPEVFKYGRWQPKSTERVREAVRKADVGVNAASSAYPLRELPEETLRRGKLFCGGKHSNYCRNWLSFFTVVAIYVLHNIHRVLQPGM